MSMHNIRGVVRRRDFSFNKGVEGDGIVFLGEGVERVGGDGSGD